MLHAFILASAIASPLDPAAVVGGEPAPEAEFDAVLRLDNLARGEGCTATLVRPDVLLTAGHCLRSVTQPDQLRAWTHDGRVVEAIDFGTHPDMCLDCGLDEFDYGFVRLSTPVDVEPMPLLVDQETWDETMYEGATVTVVGFGDVPELGTRGDRWKVEVRVRHFTRSGDEFLAGGDGADSCSGDSGGPALVRTDDGWVQVGVTARGPLDCGTGGYYGVAYSALAWFSEAVDEPGLCGSTCGTCDCVDTRPPEDGCCSTARPGPPPWWLFTAVLLFGRRRKALAPKHEGSA